MNSKRYLLALLMAGLFVVGCTQKKLPYYGIKEVKEVKNSDGSVTVDSIPATIPDFSFLNQDSVLVTQDHFKGKIYIADFFFTSCSTICPVMHRNLKAIYDLYKDDESVYFLSHTIDFKYDKPSKLKSYAQKLGVDGKKWQFLYGTKEEIYNLAEKHYLVAVGEDSTARDGYIHQGYLMLIDKDRHIRGAFDGTNDQQVAELKEAIKTLQKEYK